MKKLRTNKRIIGDRNKKKREKLNKKIIETASL